MKNILRNEPVLTIYYSLILLLFLIFWALFSRFDLAFIILSLIFTVSSYPVYQIRRRIKLYRAFMHFKFLLNKCDSKIDVVNIGFVIKSVKSKHYKKWQRIYWQEIDTLYNNKLQQYAT